MMVRMRPGGLCLSVSYLVAIAMQDRWHMGFTATADYCVFHETLCK